MTERRIKRRYFSRYLSVFVLMVATASVTLSTLRNDAFQLKQHEQRNALKATITNETSSIHKDIPYRNITLNFTDKTTSTSTVLVDNNVSLCTQIRNEPPEDVIEWLTYYRLVYNVSGVCIIDDASTIDYSDIFHSFSVSSVPSRNDRNQNFDLCPKCLGIQRDDEYARIFITDVDEFLLVQQEERFAEYLSLFNQVSLNALNHGNAHETRDPNNSSLVLQNTQRAPHYCLQESFNHSLTCRNGCWYDTVKSIVKIKAVQQYLTHTSKVNGITVPMHCNVAAIHHYFIRSRQEFQSKYTWEENSNWDVHKRYEHVLENIDYYRSVPDDRLKEHISQTIPNYATVLEEYKSALLKNDTTSE